METRSVKSIISLLSASSYLAAFSHTPLFSSVSGNNTSLPYHIYSVVQNVFITIITDGYLSIKYRSNYDWLEKSVAPPLPMNMTSSDQKTTNDIVMPGVAGSMLQEHL